MNNRFPNTTSSRYRPDGMPYQQNQDPGNNQQFNPNQVYRHPQLPPQIVTSPSPSYPQSPAMGKLHQSSISAQLSPLSSMLPSPTGISPRKSMAGLISPISGTGNIPFQPTTSPVAMHPFQQQSTSQMHSPVFRQTASYQQQYPVNPAHAFRTQSPNQSQLLMIQTQQKQQQRGAYHQLSPQPGFPTNYPPIPQNMPQPFDQSQLKAARQLNMQLSPGSYTNPQTMMPTEVPPQLQRNPTQDACLPTVEPTLPVLSLDTLDILSDLPVTETPTATVKPLATTSDHIQRSPLLQKQLLMPLKPVSSATGQLLETQNVGQKVIMPSPSSPSQLLILKKEKNTDTTNKTNDQPKEAETKPIVKMDSPVKLDDEETKTSAEPTTAKVKSTNAVTYEPMDISSIMPQKSELELQREKICNREKEELEQHEEDFKIILEELFFLQNGGNIMDFSQFRKKPSNKLLEFLKRSTMDAQNRRARKESQDSLTSGVESPSSESSSKSHKKRDKKMSSDSDVVKPASSLKLDSIASFTKKKDEVTEPPNLHKIKRLNPRHIISSAYDESIGSQEEILERAKQEAVIQRKVVELRKQGLWSQKRLPKVQEPPRNKTHWDYLLDEMRWLSADFAQERKWKRAAARKLVRTVANFHKDQEEKLRRAEREEQMKLRRIASTMAREIKNFWRNIEKVVDYKQQSLLGEKRQKALDIHLNFIVDQTEKYSDWLTQGLNQPMSVGSASPLPSSKGSKHGSDDEFLPQGDLSDDEETIAFAEQEIDKDSTENELTLLEQESKLPFDELLSNLPKEVIENIGKPLEENKEDKVEELKEEEKDAKDKSDDSEAKAESKPQVSGSEDEGNSKPLPISLRRSARKRKPNTSDLEDQPKKKTSKGNEDSKEVSSSTATSSTASDTGPTKAEGSKSPVPADDSSDFSSGEMSDSDNEETIDAEESNKDKKNYKEEIDELEADNNLSIEELMKKYSDPVADDNVEQPATPDPESSQKEKDEEDSSEDEASSNSESEEEIGMDYLLEKDLSKDNQPAIIPPSTKPSDGSPNKEITDVAAEAASLQPTGTTLATTQVVTPIPILLRHTLREYQHIGLDWLVTMYDKRLNGILADEMGLGKTIQTIALLAHLACEKGVWGPHLIVVPTSVMLNWEMEFKKWCPGFKILTYYGNQKERKLKRTGWTKSNAFHVCITSYKLVLQDHTSFRRKKWKYLVLDEAQNIKNFKSQRWQSLLNFNSQRRLLLTGTPLQNNLMELWSLMHFLMPHVFQSHKEFKEWFSNPLTGMIEGSQEYSEGIVRRLHKVLRPFLLRRVKKDVEKQMPNKYEHVVMCHLSKRQRFLYEDFMSRAATKDSLASGHFMSVINILMQLRKVCNHPNLFEPRPIVSPFTPEVIVYYTASIITKVLDKGPFETVNLPDILSMCSQTRLQVQRTSELQVGRKLIQEMDTMPQEPDRPSLKFGVREKLMRLVKEKDENSIKPNIPPLLNISSNQNAKLLSINQSKSSEDSKPITLQYQTAQGTRWATIPNRQIRHLPGGVVQIVTSGIHKEVPQNATIITTQAKQETKPATAKYQKFEPVKDLLNIEDVVAYNQEDYSKILSDRSQAERFATLQRIAQLNEHRCAQSDNWMAKDTIETLERITKDASFKLLSSKFNSHYSSSHENGMHRHNPLKSSLLQEAIKSPLEKLKKFKPITNRFVFFIPKVLSRSIDFHVSHPTPMRLNARRVADVTLQHFLSQSASSLHSVQSSMTVQFPEARLIQYDCGKLQVLNVLLRRFWTEKHRCLIFTQMTKVLDILEQFLSYHGYRYLRLDGSTKVEQRMSLMERFNNDPRIFIFILSTRSGGVGVNLTGADTVIFYDSDWNPTMDAQAQDRCHRIGQTRDVHIYRLISERTVEENILKKANQKRLLGEMAIEGGSFTTAFFKEQALKDLFKEPTGLQEAPEASEAPEAPAVLSKPITARQKAIAAAKEAESKVAEAKEGGESKPKDPESKDFEQALLDSEDKEDAAAAQLAKEEQAADLEEFDEARDQDGSAIAESSKVQDELKSIYDELTPIERYALRYLEDSTEEINYEELKMAEDQVHEAKKEWELTHLVALKHEEERRLEEEDEIFYTREDAENEIWIDDVTGEIMPIWFPPTPPEDNTDMYIDVITNLLYKSVPMPDIELPALHSKKDRKRTKALEAAAHGPKKKTPRWDFHIPSSLFNRITHTKKKDKSKSSKKQTEVAATATAAPVAVKESVVTPTIPLPTVDTTTTQPTPAPAKDTTVPATHDTSDWLVTEDWALLQAVQQVLDLPLSLAALMPAHTPNWDVVSDIVNAVSAIYRSSKMCKQRFEQVIAPREDGRAGTEVSVSSTPKKKTAKALSKLKTGKVHKTSAMLSSDNNLQLSRLHTSRFQTVKSICNKRALPSRSNSTSQFQRNPKHATILLDNNICYDKPLSPKEVATMRANRIAREKKLAADQAKQTANQQTTASTHVQITTTQLPKTITPGTSLTAIPLSTSNIIVNSLTAALSRKLNQQNVQQQLNASKITTKQTLLRPTNQQPIQITQGSAVSLPAGTSLHRLATSSGITVTTTLSTNTVTTRPPTITLASQVKLTPQQIQVVAKQRLKPGTGMQKAQITPQRVQLTPQQMKQLRLVHQQQQQQQQQQLVVSASGQQTKVAAAPGGVTRQFQTTRGGTTATLSAQDFTLLMSKNFGKTIQQRGNKVHIAPILAHEQAQQVQVAAAQQAATQNASTSKPLPITVPVSNIAVNLTPTNMSIANTGANTSKLSTMGITQSYIIQQQQLMKQRQQTQQQQQPRQVNLTSAGTGKKAVYTMQKRKLTATLVPQSVSMSSQQPVAVTVTKLLQPPGGTQQQKNQQQPQQIQGTQIRMSQPQATHVSVSATGHQQALARLVNPQQRQNATINIHQFKQLVSGQASTVHLVSQQHNVTMAPVAVATTTQMTAATSKISPNIQQHQIQLVPSQIQLRRQPTPTSGNPTIITQQALPQVTTQTVANVPAAISSPNPAGNIELPKTQPTVQVAVLPDTSSNQNVVMPTEKQDQ